jgi:hypothetical protein
MLLKFYHHSYPLFEAKNSLIYIIDENMYLNIFEMVANINELAKELVNQQLLIYCRHQVDAKDINFLLGWWRKHKTMFLTIH